MCYDYPTGLIVLFLMSVVLNFLLGYSYIKLKGSYDSMSKIIEDFSKVLRKAGKIK